MSNSKIIAKVLSCITLISILPACGANMKPDHPQVYENFKNRRAPKENQLLNSGAALDPSDQRASQFIPYTGAVADNPNKSELNGGVDATDLRSHVPTPNPSNSTNGNDSGEQKSFWERLKQKFSSNEMKPELSPRMQVSGNYGASRKAVIADLPQYIEQGSSSDYSYYDMAEPVLASEQVAAIQLAANASSPLVAVPEIESFDALEKQSHSNKNPNLVEVPQPPKARDAYLEPKKHTETKAVSKGGNTHKPLPSSHSQKSQSQPQENAQQDEDKQIPLPQVQHTSHKAPAHDNVNKAAKMPQESDIQDAKAKLVYRNGHYIVTGTMGSLKKEMNR